MFAGTGRMGDVQEAGYGKNCPSHVLLQIISNFRIFYIQYFKQRCSF
jgi:hypothetical protein